MFSDIKTVIVLITLLICLCLKKFLKYLQMQYYDIWDLLNYDQQ